MTFSKKLFKVIFIMACIHIVFVTIVFAMFHAIRNDPIDQIAMPYIWADEEMQTEYGSVFLVSRNVTRKIKKTENTMDVPYSVETDDKCLTVYVQLEKQEENWTAVSIEIIKVESR